MRSFVQQLEHSPLQFAVTTQADMPRIYKLLDQYSDMHFDFVDAATITLAERLNIQRILTVDGDFRIVRPQHCAHFEVLP